MDRANRLGLLAHILGKIAFFYNEYFLLIQVNDVFTLNGS